MQKYAVLKETTQIEIYLFDKWPFNLDNTDPLSFVLSALLLEVLGLILAFLTSLITNAMRLRLQKNEKIFFLLKVTFIHKVPMHSSYPQTYEPPLKEYFQILYEK